MTPGGRRPLLAPMSQLAGRVATQVGATTLATVAIGMDARVVILDRSPQRLPRARGEDRRSGPDLELDRADLNVAGGQVVNPIAAREIARSRREPPVAFAATA
jgi:alanine dehydrogenase